MLEHSTERRHVSDRRSTGAGGRRLTDLAGRPFDSPTCPMCREAGAASLAGESDGGWWFVCLACDHVWDQRAHREARGAPIWRRLSFRRAHG